MALTDSDHPGRLSLAGLQARLKREAGGLRARIKAWFADGADRSLAQRVAGAAFLIRVVSAGLIYLLQVLLARWMGRFEFGIYVYVTTWLVVLGGLAPLGLAYTAQRFIPEYAGDSEKLRGFLSGARWLSFSLGLAAATIGCVTIVALHNVIPAFYVIPFLLAFACLPIFSIASAQDSIARSFNWIDLALMPTFIAQPILMMAAIAGFYVVGFPVNAIVAMAAAATIWWTTTLVQLVIVNRRLRGRIEPGLRRYEVRHWLRTSLPIFLVDSFFFLLASIDIILLQFFVGPEDVAVYYAATKTLALVAFVYFAVSAASAHRFSEYHVAGDKDKLAAFVARWTFWPSLAMTLVLLVLGEPILMLFGDGFARGYPIICVLAIGLLCRASIGPAERLLNMVGEQRVCAVVYGTALATNVALCLLLVPRLGPIGAACATATAVLMETVLLAVFVRRRLGLHVFVWQRKPRASA